MSNDEKKYLISKVGTVFNKVKWLLFIPYFVELLKSSKDYKNDLLALFTYQKYFDCELHNNKIVVIYEPDKREARLNSNLDVLFKNYEFTNAGTFREPKRKFTFDCSEELIDIFKRGEYSKMYSSNTLSDYKKAITDIKYMDSDGNYLFPNTKSYYILTKDKEYQQILESELDLAKGTLDNIELESKINE